MNVDLCISMKSECLRVRMQGQTINKSEDIYRNIQKRNLDDKEESK